MNQTSQRTRRLGISLSSRGFGYAVLEGENRLVDFGRKRLYANRNGETLAGVKKMLARYQPDVLVLQDANKAKGTNRISRIKQLTDKISFLAKKQKIKVVKISGGELRVKLLGNAEGTKHEMAVLLSQRFPEQLASRLPAKRRTQDNEDPRMDYFDAVGLVVGFQAPPSLD
jgi:Holliday junction resolvasome RuvABC endonuclease subunit